MNIKMKNGINVSVLQHSITNNGDEIISFELEYHRFVHGEFMTHRDFSRNGASSRAIPLNAMIGHVVSNLAQPIYWGSKQAGMVAGAENKKKVRLSRFNEDGTLADPKYFTTSELWHHMSALIINAVIAYDEAGYHKQIPNRLLEPFQMMKVVMTTTRLSNFFNLRIHKNTQPEIRELAVGMYVAYKASTPLVIGAGEYHTPYLERRRDSTGVLHYFVSNEDGSETEVPVEDAKKISTTACAQVSYRKLDTTPHKVQRVFDMLLLDDVIHASSFEHVATPIVIKESLAKHLVKNWPIGVTHMDAQGNLWSGNLKGFIQYRQEIAGNAYNNYDEALDTTIQSRITEMGYDFEKLFGSVEDVEGV